MRRASATESRKHAGGFPGRRQGSKSANLEQRVRGGGAGR